MQMPFVDVIIPHLDDHHRLALCLQDLTRQTYPADRFAITVVANGSERPIDGIVGRFPGMRAAFEAERGCGSARNRGVAESSGNILAFTDSDCRPDRDWILNGVRALTPGSGIDIVGGDIHVFAVDEKSPTDAELFDKVFGFEPKRYVERKHFATGANIMVSRRIFEAVGPFRNGSLPEDLEWGQRATRLGYRIAYRPDVVINHPARRTLAELRKKAERTTWHARNHWSETPHFRLRWSVYTLAMTSPPLLKTAKIIVSPALHGMTQRRRAIATLWRMRYYRAALMARYLMAPVAKA
jgi:GT2 family glycosyltransferase